MAPVHTTETTLKTLTTQCLQGTKRKFINDLAKQAQTAAKQHRIKDLYDLTKKLFPHQNFHICTSFSVLVVLVRWAHILELIF